MILLSRWAFCSKEQGGLDAAVSREAAADLLAGVFRCLDGRKPVTIELCLDSQWVCCWPRPHALHDKEMITLRLHGYNLDLGPLVHLASIGHKVAKAWLRPIARQLGVQVLDVTTVIQGTAGIIASASFLGQLCWQISLLLERDMGGSVSDEGAISKAFTFQADQNWMEDERAMHAHLCKYVSASIEASKGQQFYFVATDKGHPGGYPLQNTLITFPNNVGIVAPPAVVFKSD